MRHYLNHCRRLLITGCIFPIASIPSLAQSISGLIHDENNHPVPFANVFIRELGSGTSSDDKGKYFLTIDPGIYNVVVSSMGFHAQTVQVIVKDKPIVKNFNLQSSSVELNEIEIRVRRRDPAYEIIQKVIDNKEKFLSQVKSYKTNVYVKANETVDKKKKKSTPEEEPEEIKKTGPPLDPFEEAKKKKKRESKK